jgi:uncharacterized protein (DUF302 family)
MKRLLASLALFGLFQISVEAADIAGLVTVESAHDVPTTTDKLVTAIEEKGLTVFSRIDHAAGAQKAGMTLPPTELVIFGAPKVGTALMQCGHTVAIDLPLKALVWQDGEGVVHLSYNTPAWVAERHHLAGCEKVLEKVDGALKGFADAATH